MYNGIGVQTARGTGTSGHVMKNIGSLRPSRHDVAKLKSQTETGEPSRREVDPGILIHAGLRKIELELVNLRDLLEEEYDY